MESEPRKTKSKRGNIIGQLVLSQMSVTFGEVSFLVAFVVKCSKFNCNNDQTMFNVKQKLENHLFINRSLLFPDGSSNSYAIKKKDEL
ncbi:12971_t:CDS:2, partial [Racocetra persica]